MDETDQPDPAKETDSGWDQLADEIGATPSPDALQRRRPTVESNFEIAPPKQQPSDEESSDWNALAGELGIELPEPSQELPSPAEDEAPSQVAEEPQVGAEAADGGVAASDDPEADESLFASLPAIPEHQQNWAEEAAGGSSGDGGLSDEGDLLEEASSSEDVQAFHPAFDEDSPPTDLVDEADDASAEDLPAEEFDEFDFTEADDIEASDADGVDEDESQALTGDAARSAFDALFASGSFDSMEVDDVDNKADDSTLSESARFKSAATGGDEPSKTSGDIDELFADEPPKKKGGWFGFGRSRDKSKRDEDAKPEAKQIDDTQHQQPTDEPEDWLGKSATDSADMSSDDEKSDEGDATEKTGRRRRRRRRRKPAAKDDQASTVSTENGRPRREDETSADPDEELLEDEENLDDQEAVEESAGSRRRPMHKNIPTWADAVGVMIETNMQGRKQSRERASSPRSNGGGKGRGRGGRRRKKPS